jgi:hypothetical protein
MTFHHVRPEDIDRHMTRFTEICGEPNTSLLDEAAVDSKDVQ